MQSTASRTKSIELTKIWRAETDLPFTADEMLDAYYKGKEDQKNEQEQILAQKYRQNLDLAHKAAGELLALLKELKFKVSDIWLNPITLTSFSTMLLVDEKDYLKEEFDMAYAKARETKQKFNNKTFTISFSFTPTSPKLNLTGLLSDGYYLRYAKTSGKA